ncbi:class I SAM-dependent methyltransferase [Streptomyces alanosinicus]|nr:class I SAM-dependent methyltransferase [Streptomyces alanosinicus]
MGAEAYRQGTISHRVPEELHRLHLLEQVLDPGTIAILDRLGVAPTWRCAELGAGAGSVAGWLADRCPDGRVVATDIDTDFLRRTNGPENLEILQHDAAVDDFTPGSFDLVHARALLSHIRDRDAVLAKMAAWLAPGGWLVVEDAVFLPAEASPYPEFRELLWAIETLFAQVQGSDVRWGRRIPAALAGCGLVDVGLSVTPSVCGNGGIHQEFWRANFTQAAAAIVQTGLLTTVEVDTAVNCLEDPGFSDLACLFVSGWARKPELVP